MDGLTYPEVGATRGVLPPGYRHLAVQRRIGGPDVAPERFELVADALLTWRVHRAAGVRVSADGPVDEGRDALVRIGVGPLSLRAPCRVVWVERSPRWAAFAYGTRRGHVAVGEEMFVLHRGEDGAVWFTVRAFSRPAGLLARLAGPLMPWSQRGYARLLARAAGRLLRHGAVRDTA